MQPNTRCEAKFEDRRGAMWKIATITHVIRRSTDKFARNDCDRIEEKAGTVIAVIVQYDNDLELISKKPHLIRRPGAIDRLAAVIRPPPGRRYGLEKPT